MTDQPDPNFIEARDRARERINKIDTNSLGANPKRDAFFETVYKTAEGDPTLVPWADLAPKEQLTNWLAKNAVRGERAVDVGCGLGDNAEAIASAGYETTGFDFSARAIEWAKLRYPDTLVNYKTADLFELPDHFREAFDLVNECYTLQSIPSETLATTVPAIASLVAPGGRLLIYTRIMEEGGKAEGPPWPLYPSAIQAFTKHGLVNLSHESFDLVRPDRKIPHVFSVWQKPK